MRTEDRAGPTQGVQPREKVMPTTHEPASPQGLLVEMDDFLLVEKRQLDNVQVNEPHGYENQSSEPDNVCLVFGEEASYERG